MHRALRSTCSAMAILLFLVAGCLSLSARAADAARLTPQDLLRQMASSTSDDCSEPVSPGSEADAHRSEDQLFSAVGEVITDRLNAHGSAATSEVVSRARSSLLAIEHWSEDINKSWPSEDRFQFELLALPPALLLRMSYRHHATILLFGSYHLDKDAAVDSGAKWRQVSFVDPNPDSRTSSIDLFPLRRGPDGSVRFLVRAWRSGCAGSIGEAYYGYKWGARQGQFPTEIIKIEGAEGLDDAASKHVGKLSTMGKIIQLPYCYFSAVDTWDNPTLCAADSFDLSEDDGRFIGRIDNHPDLAALNNAIHHAQAHDYVALRGYCASDSVARKLLREMPPFLLADDLKTFKVGPRREKIVFEEGAVYFNLIKRRGQWRLSSFKIADDR